MKNYILLYICGIVDFEQECEGSDSYKVSLKGSHSIYLLTRVQSSLLKYFLSRVLFFIGFLHITLVACYLPDVTVVAIDLILGKHSS